jgi:hypothetical protein
VEETQRHEWRKLRDMSGGNSEILVEETHRYEWRKVRDMSGRKSEI